MSTTKVVIITGAAQGIGRGIAQQLAKDGFALVLADVAAARSKLDAVVVEVEAAGARAIGLECDVRRKGEVDALVTAATDAFGRLDVMVANAGIAPTDTFLDITPEMYDNLYAINVRGVLFCYQAAARQFISQGWGGKLIAACSVSGFDTQLHKTAYCSTKFAVRSLNQGASREFGKHGITANVYCPGTVNTDMWRAMDEANLADDGKPAPGVLTQRKVDATPLGRIAEPEDVARLVSFLAGPASDFVSGQAIQVCVRGAEYVT
ncbi:Diacetyl reductase [(S)-acetoin forming] [Vanrija pseudolonga]|uniref:Diacetyl reductase [(S)-acetoin forming] n=1 Tax=Vanrija pseudolonga TaxID=143232 RepID=A0AAF1BLS3_9TREE|nr:Diacetyl reductase [(S)-acetoin forming] [Vanrija pseudolonga]